VKLKKVLALASSFAALSLGACSTTMMTTSERSRPAPQASASVAGTYLAANFAAAQGDVKAATSFYANSLKDDPANADLLERTFLFAAEAGEIDQAIGLTDRVLMQDSSNRPAHLVLEVGALAKKDYAAVIKDVGSPSPGLFAALTNRVIEAWARAGMRDFDGAVNALDSLTMQRGVDGLRLMHSHFRLCRARQGCRRSLSPSHHGHGDRPTRRGFLWQIPLAAQPRRGSQGALRTRIEGEPRQSGGGTRTARHFRKKDCAVADRFAC
jgi:hypothetical protein